jgi:hypothetical protein
LYAAIKNVLISLNKQEAPGLTLSGSFILMFLMVIPRCFKEVSGWMDGIQTAGTQYLII